MSAAYLISMALQASSPQVTADAAVDQQEQKTPDQPPDEDAAPPPVNNGVIQGRRRPGYVEPLPPPVTQENPGAVRAPPPEAFPTAGG